MNHWIILGNINDVLILLPIFFNKNLVNVSRNYLLMQDFHVQTETGKLVSTVVPIVITMLLTPLIAFQGNQLHNKLTKALNFTQSDTVKQIIT